MKYKDLAIGTVVRLTHWNGCSVWMVKENNYSKQAMILIFIYTNIEAYWPIGYEWLCSYNIDSHVSIDWTIL